MNGLDLFAGSGIGSLALKHTIPEYRTICYVEWDKYCQKIIQARVKDGVLDDAPIWDDVRTFDGKQWRGKVDFISGGFPCQPFSVAGKQKGESDERNMWPDTFRVVSEIRPRYIFLENVPNLLTHKYIRRIFGDLVEIGYDCEWDVVSAAFVGAPHLRKRVWIMAIDRYVAINRSKYGKSGLSANKKNNRKHNHTSHNRKRYSPSKIWNKKTESSVARISDGVANRVDRLKMLGNGWIPQVVRRILSVEETE